MIPWWAGTSDLLGQPPGGEQIQAPSLMALHQPPEDYPFTPVLSSLDPDDIYPDAHALGATLPSEVYEFPNLPSDQAAYIQACVDGGGVVDPLNLVLWGNATAPNLKNMVSSLGGWTATFASSPQWGLGVGEASGRTHDEKLTVFRSIQPQTIPTLIRRLHLGGIYVHFTKVVSSFTRQHVRVFNPFFAGSDWGYVALAGAHTEVVGPRHQFPWLWHRVVDWHAARDGLAADLSNILGGQEPSERYFRTEGRWQRREFDGVMKFLHFDSPVRT